MKPIRTDWPKVGRHVSDGNRKRLSRIFQRVVWEKVVPGLTMAAMPGFVINAAIDQLNLPAPSHVTKSHELAPYGLVGLRCSYKNALIEVFIIDEGNVSQPIGIRVFEPTRKEPRE